jgi:AMP-binding enzyme C-terminal domain
VAAHADSPSSAPAHPLVPDELAGRWRPGTVLKRDVFSTVERGHFQTPNGEIEAILRRIDEVQWWSSPIAWHLFHRERKALAVAGKLGIGPALHFAGRRALVRGWIDGLALHIAQPHGDVAYFRSAKRVLAKLHRAGLSHNDLAKQQNWLRGSDGQAYLIDFQLAQTFARRGRLFRIAAYEDLRHLLKQKRRFVPDALTASERRVLGRKSLVSRAWMTFGKPVYHAITRGLFRFTDREGGGRRLVYDAPPITQQIKAYPGVRDAAVVAFPDRRRGVGLYAFVEADPAVAEPALRQHVVDAVGAAKAPEHLQVVAALPRRPNGDIQNEILHLIATNQVELIPPLIADEAQRSAVDRIIADRRFLQDRLASH